MAELEQAKRRITSKRFSQIGRSAMTIVLQKS
jgi:hypothetical protein